MTWYGRSEWTDSKAGCSTLFDGVKGVAIHYPGGNLPADVAAGKHAATGKFLNGVRSMQMASKEYDYCDIEYSVCADRAGDIWTLRGLKVRTGANGTSLANAQYVSVFTLVGLTSAKAPTKEQVKAVRRIVQRVRETYPGAKEIRGHREFVATACPGSVLWEMVQDGTFEPGFVRRAIRKTIRKTKRAIKKLRRRLKESRARLDNWRHN
jgi:hypothetical protein